MLEAVNAARWWGPAGYAYRDLLANWLAGYLNVATTALAISVIVPRTRHWWERKIKAAWRRHEHHGETARQWWHAPVLEQQAAHHDEQMAAHRAVHDHLGITRSADDGSDHPS